VLPAPFDEDFTRVVTRVNRKRERFKVRLANSVQVASFLKAGSLLIEREFGFHELTRFRPDARAGTYLSGLRFLTQEAVMEQVKRLDHPFERRQTPGTFRATWKSHDDYIDDLLTFFFHPINYEHQYGVEEATRKGWFAHESLADAINETAHQEVVALCRMPLFRLQIMMAAVVGRDDRIRNAISDNYRGAIDPWVRIYEETFAARGLRVRDDVTIRDVADMLAFVVEGCALRSLGDPTAEVVAEAPGRNLVGKAILGILSSYLVPIGHPPTEPLSVEFDRRTRRIRPLE